MGWGSGWRGRGFGAEEERPPPQNPSITPNLPLPPPAPRLPKRWAAGSLASLPVLLVLVSALRAAVRVTVGVVVEVHFVHGLDGLGQIVL